MPRITMHPGEVLHEEFMVPMGISANQLGADLRVPANRVSEIVAGRRSVTPDTALRLSEYFGTTDRFWMNLQVAHDLSRAEAEHGAEIRAEVRHRLTAQGRSANT